MKKEEEINMPTRERVIQADMTDGMALLLLKGNDLPVAKVINPLRIDRLLASKVLDEKQHQDAKRLYTLWLIVGRQFLTQMQYSDPETRIPKQMILNDGEGYQLQRLSAQDQYYDVNEYLKKRGHKRLINLIVCEEMGMAEAAAYLGIHPRHARHRTIKAFNALGRALELAKEKRKRFEKGVVTGNE